MSRFALYVALLWSVLIALSWGAIPQYPALLPALLVAGAAYLTIPLFVFVARGGGWARYPTAAFRLYVVRPVLYAQLLLPLVAGAAVLGGIVGLFGGSALTAARITALATLAVAALVLFAGWLGSRSLVVREVEAVVPGLPPAFEGFRIAQVSDLHLGPQSSRRFLRRVSASIRALHADLVTVTGDLVDDRAEDARLFGEWIETLGSPPHGVHLIPGNHDVYAGWREVHDGVRAHSRAHVLVNEAQMLTRGGALLAIVGIGDPAADGHRGRFAASDAAPDVPRAFRSVPAGVPVVVFAHNPALWPVIASRGAGLTLSGHTHWGQFAFPRKGWSLASPFLEHAMGAYQQGEALLYVHPGTGFWGIPFRIGALPEVTAVTLRRGAEASIVMGTPRSACGAKRVEAA